MTAAAAWCVGIGDSGRARLADLRRNDATRRVVLERFGMGDGIGRASGELEELRVGGMGGVGGFAEWFEVPGRVAGTITCVEAMFLHELARCVRPSRIVEVGVAWGTSSAVLVRAMGLNPSAARDGAWVHSFDVHHQCYFDRSCPVGSAVREMVPGLAGRYALHTGMGSAEAGRMLAGERIGFAFIDADHRHPWPAVDILNLAPALAPGAWVALHDIDLPAMARRHEARTGRRVTWYERGAEMLFLHWPFEKIAGVGPGGENIGAVRMPMGSALRAEDLCEVIGLAWEVEPGEAARRTLGKGSGA